MQAGVFLVFQTCFLLGWRYWKWNSYGELVESCFGMNRAAILVLSIFPAALQMALCGEPRGKRWLYSPDAFQVWVFQLQIVWILVLEFEREQLCSLGMTESTSLWPGPLDPVVSIESGLCCFIVAVDEALGGESLSALVLLYGGHSPALQFSLSHLLPNFLSWSRRWASSGLIFKVCSSLGL